MIPNVSTSGPYVGIAKSRDMAPSSRLQSGLVNNLRGVCTCFDAGRMLILEKPLMPPVPGQSRRFVECTDNMNIYLKGADMSILWLAAGKGHTPVVERILLHKNVDPNLIAWGETALHVAARMKQKDVVALLLNDPRVNVKTINTNGKTVFEDLADRGEPEMLKVLLEDPTRKFDGAESRKLKRHALAQQVTRIKMKM